MVEWLHHVEEMSVLWKPEEQMALNIFVHLH